jgi:hypothetical protein
MNRKIIALLALLGLAAACHEQRQDPPMDENAIRAHAAEAHSELDRQKTPQGDEAH